MKRKMQAKRDKTSDELLNEALRLAAAEHLEEAAQVLTNLTRDYPDDMDVRFAYAAIFFRLKRFADAAPHFARVLEGQPVNEWASLGLFHSFWKIDRRQDAIDEIRRFRAAGGDSMEYRRLFKDMKKFAD